MRDAGRRLRRELSKTPSRQNVTQALEMLVR